MDYMSVENIEQMTSEETEEESEEPTDHINIDSKIFFAPPYILEDDYIETPEFQEGIKKALGISGIYSTFVSNGISEDDSIDLIMKMMDAELSIKLAEINKEAAEFLSKISVVY